MTWGYKQKRDSFNFDEQERGRLKQSVKGELPPYGRKASAPKMRAERGIRVQEAQRRSNKKARRPRGATRLKRSGEQ